LGFDFFGLTPRIFCLCNRLINWRLHGGRLSLARGSFTFGEEGGMSALPADKMVLPDQVPVMTLPNATLFPQALLPLYIFEPRYRKMLKDALQADRMFSVAMQKPGRTRETPCTVAGLGLIRVSVDHKDGTSHLILQGLTRVELQETVRYKPYRVHTIRPLSTTANESVAVDALVARVHELVERRLELQPAPLPFPLPKKGKKDAGALPFTLKEILDYLGSLPDAAQVADLVSCALLPDAQERQAILETVEIEARLQRLIRFLLDEIERVRKG
jgi:Lon protease-like protein